MRKTLFLALSLFIGLDLFAIHNGRVFVDSNQNGVYDKGERPLSGVMVSDGLNVVLTDSEGYFNLPGHQKERFISVTTPSGYKPANQHYIPISNQTLSYDFALKPWHKVNKSGKHSFIQITDTEIRDLNSEHKIWANNVRDYAHNEDVAFIIHTGDICYEGGLKNHIKLMNSENMGVPMYYIIGNHDLVKGDYGEQLFESIYGPVWFSFDYGNVHYIVTPMPSGDYAPSYKEADVYEWLKNDLALIDKNKPIILFNHDLLTKNGDEFIYQKNEIEKIVLNKEYNLKAWIYGHWHNHFIKMIGGVKTISTATLDKGGIDHSTSAFRVMEVDKRGNLETQLKYTFIDNSIEIASIDDNVIALNNKGESQLVVNTYSSTKKVNSVSFSLYTLENELILNKQLKKMSDWSWMDEFKIPNQYLGKQLFLTATANFSDDSILKTKASFNYTNNNQLALHPTDNWTNLLKNSTHVVGATYNSFTFPLSIAWINNVKANLYFSSPIVYNGDVFIVSVDEELRGESAIYAIDGKTGKLKWRYQTRNSIKNSIVADSGNVFAQDGEGYLYAINAKNGRLVWEKNLGVNILPVIIEGIAARNGVIYAGTGKALGAYDAKNGTPIWTNQSWNQNQGATSTITVNDEVLLLGSQWGALYGHDAKSGKLLWKISKYGISNRGSSPALYENIAYFLAANSLFVIDAKRGEIIQKKDFDFSVDATSTPLITDKLIIFGTVNKGLVALNKEDYKQVWSVNTQDALVYTSPYTTSPSNTVETSPILVGNMVVFGASDGNLYGTDVENGKILWMHQTGAPVFGTFALSGNALYATDFGGNIYAFTSSNNN